MSLVMTCILVIVILSFLVSNILLAAYAKSDLGGSCGSVPDNRQYALNRITGNVTVIDTDTNSVTGHIDLPNNGELVGLALAHDGSKLYVSGGSNGRVFVIDTRTNRVIDTISVGISPHEIVVSPDDRRAYVLNTGNHTVNESISVIDTSTDSVVASLGPDDYSPSGIVISPDSSRAYVSSYDSDVRVLDTGTFKELDTLPATGYLVAISPDGKLLYIFTEGKNGFFGNLATIDILNKQLVSNLDVGFFPASALSPEGKRLYLTGNRSQYNNSVTVIDTINNVITTKITLNDSPSITARAWAFDIKISPDGKTVYVANLIDDYIRVIDAETCTEKARIPAGYGHSGLAIS